MIIIYDYIDTYIICIQSYVLIYIYIYHYSLLYINHRTKWAVYTIAMSNDPKGT